MFSKSERFNEKGPEGPPSLLTHTDWAEMRAAGVSAFDKSERFKDMEVNETSSDSTAVVDGAGASSANKSLSKRSTTAKGAHHLDQSKLPRKVVSVDTGRIAELEHQVKQLLAERADLNKMLTTSHSEVTKLEGKLQGAAKDKSSLQAQVASLHKENLDLTRGRRILQAKLDSESETRKASVIQTQLQSQLDQMEKKTGDKEKEIEKLKKQLASTKSSFQEKLQKEREASRALEEELVKKAERVTRLEGEVESKLESLEVVRKEVLSVSQSKEMLKDELSKDVCGLRDEIKLLVDKCEKAQVEMKAKSVENAQLQSKVTAQQEAAAVSEKRLEESAEQIMCVRKQMENESGNLNAALAQKVEELHKMEAELRTSSKRFEEEIAAEKESRENALLERSQKVDLIGQMGGEIAALQRDIELANEETETLKDVKSDLESQVSKLDCQVLELKEKASELTDRSEHTKSELEAERNAKMFLETKCYAQEESIATLQEQFRTCAENAKVAAERLSTEAAHRVELESKLSQHLDHKARLEEEATTMMEQAKKEVASERQAKGKMEKSLKATIDCVGKLEKDVSRLDSVVQQHKEIVASGKEANKVLQASMVHEREVAAKMKEKARVREDALRKGQEDLKHVHIKMVHVEGNLKSSKQTAAMKTQENEKLQRKLKEMEGRSDDITALKRQVTEEKSSSTALQAKHQKEMQSLAKKCSLYEEEIAKQATLIKDSERISEHKLDGLRKEQQEALESLTKKCLTLEEELAHQKGNGQEAQDVLAKKFETVQECNEERKAELDIHYRMRTGYLARIEELEAENEEMRLGNEQLRTAYSEIEERYRPFQDQIDGLEEINHFLKGQTTTAVSEAQKLSELYSKLLGHQNQKQKIQHVKKLKDENAMLKHDMSKLKAEVARYKRMVARLEVENMGIVQVPSLKRPATFHPSKPSLVPKN